MAESMSPADQVLAQLGRQKWAVDTRDAEALTGLYTADSGQVVYRGGPDGRKEIARSRGLAAQCAVIHPRSSTFGSGR